MFKNLRKKVADEFGQSSLAISPTEHILKSSADGDSVSDLSSVADLGTLSKERVLALYQRSCSRYNKYRGRYSDLLLAYHRLEAEHKDLQIKLVNRSDSDEPSSAPLSPPAAAGPLSNDERGGDGACCTDLSEEAVLSPSHSEVATLTEKLHNREQLLQECVQRFEAGELRLAAVAKEKEQLQQQLQQLNTSISEMQEARADEMSRWQAVSAELRAELAQWQRKAEQSASDCSRLQTSVDQAHGEVAKLRANLASKDKTITELETKVETLNADLHRARVDNETSLKNLETACDEEKASLIQELSKAKQEALRVLEAELESRLSAQWSRRLELREQQLLTEVQECREQLKLVAEEEQLRETAVTTASHQQLVRSQSVVETLRADNTRLESSLSESQAELTRAAEQHQQLMTSARADFQLQRQQLDQQLQLVTEQLGSCEKQLQLSRDECEQLTERLSAAEQACAQSKSRSEEADNLQRVASSDLRQQLVQLLAGESSYSGDIEQLADSQLSTAAASELKRLAEERERLQLLVRERECELERRETAEEQVLRTARADLESALVTARCELDATRERIVVLQNSEQQLSQQLQLAADSSEQQLCDVRQQHEQQLHREREQWEALQQQQLHAEGEAGEQSRLRCEQLEARLSETRSSLESAQQVLQREQSTVKQLQTEVEQVRTQWQQARDTTAQLETHLASEQRSAAEQLEQLRGETAATVSSLTADNTRLQSECALVREREEELTQQLEEVSRKREEEVSELREEGQILQCRIAEFEDWNELDSDQWHKERQSLEERLQRAEQKCAELLSQLSALQAEKVSWTECVSELTLTRDQLVTWKERVDGLEREKERRDGEQLQCEQRVGQVSRERDELKERVEELLQADSERVQLHESKVRLYDELREESQRLRARLQQLDDVETERDLLLAELNLVKSDRTGLQAKLAAVEAVDTANEQLTARVKQLEQMVTEKDVLHEKLSSSESVRSQLESKVDERDQRVEELEKRIEEREEMIEELEKRIEEREEKIEELENRIEEREEKIEELEKKIEEREEKIEELEKRIEEREEKIEELEKRIEEREEKIDDLERIESELRLISDQSAVVIGDEVRSELEKGTSAQWEQTGSHLEQRVQQLEEEKQQLMERAQLLERVQEERAQLQNRAEEQAKEMKFLAERVQSLEVDEEERVQLKERVQEQQREKESLLDQLDRMARGGEARHTPSCWPDKAGRKSQVECGAGENGGGEAAPPPPLVVAASGAGEEEAVVSGLVNSCGDCDTNGAVSAPAAAKAGSCEQQVSQLQLVSLQRLVTHQKAELRQLTHRLSAQQATHTEEVAELRRLLAIGPSSRATAGTEPGTVRCDSVGTMAGGASSDEGSLDLSVEAADVVTQNEYLRNILYEYMLGKEPLTLAKVIAAVVKFDAKQTRSILEHEQAKQSAIMNSTVSVGSSLYSMSPFKWR